MHLLHAIASGPLFRYLCKLLIRVAIALKQTKTQRRSACYLFLRESAAKMDLANATF